MAIYEMTDSQFRPLNRTSFSTEGVLERSDLQRLIRERNDIVAPDLLVITEEFGDWEESRRRIDLLALDKDANLVVIELKRTEDGGHMELQAIRYAGMVSAMTFEKVVDIHTQFLQKLGRFDDAETAILEFLDWDEPNEDNFAQDVRVVLASEDFSTELTTAVLWLNDHGLDIRCVRLRPYNLEGRILIDSQQIIPLPEAEDYQVRLKEKEQRERKERAERFGIRRRFWTGLLDRARGKTDLHSNISPNDYQRLESAAGVRGLGLNYVVNQNEAAVELYIDRGGGRDAENKAIFDRLDRNREQIEAEFGGPLDWQRLDGKRACRIKQTITAGGYRSDEGQWPKIQDAMVDAMIRLHNALEPHIERLKAEPIASEMQTAFE